MSACGKGVAAWPAFTLAGCHVVPGAGSQDPGSGAGPLVWTLVVMAWAAFVAVASWLALNGTRKGGGL